MSDTLHQGLRTASERARGLGKVFQGFKDFISRGNAIELAVGVVIGAAFTTIVSALNTGLINPLVGMIFGRPEIQWVLGPWNGSTIDLGLIISAVIQFLLTAAAVYFLIVLPLNRLAERRKRGVEAEPARPSEDILLLQEIRDLLAAQADAARVGTTGAGAGGAGAGGAGAGAAGAALRPDADQPHGSGRHEAPGAPDARPGA